DALVDRLLDDPTPEGGVVAGGSELVELCQLDNFRLESGGRRLAISFHENWDLVDARVDRSDPGDWLLDADPFFRRVLALCDTPVPDDDKQAGRLAELSAAANAGLESDRLGERVARIVQLEDRCEKVTRCGSKTTWKQAGFDPEGLTALRADQQALAADARALLAAVRERRRRVLGVVFGRWVLDAATERAAAGTLEFHDLLVLARRLVARHPDIRRALHERYTRILLDEFQDTDPIQLEIAVRLSAAPDDPAHDTDWRSLRPLPGRLFIVGDPKQSIYRFRRADIAQYMQAAEQVGADTEILSANFRSSRPVLDWVNAVFGELIVEQPDTQPAYQALTPGRRHFLDHGSVTVFGLAEHDDLGRAKADEIRRREAADAADAVVTALVDRWQVTDEDDDGVVELRPCRPGDITVLLPARTSLPALEAALDERGVPYRAENSSVVYATTEIRHLMLALRAAADPTDELALVAALRTPLYGCSDVELYEWKAAGGRWTVWWRPDDDTPAELVDHPVGEALQHLGSLARKASRMSPADLLSTLVDDRRVLDVALDRTDARDVWRRVRYVIDQARAWSDAGGHGLRRYLAWVHLLASESRNADTILPEHDDDAVRIMTVHAAKGLEFPITVLSGMTTKPYAIKSNAVVWFQDTWTISNTSTPDSIFEDFIPIDEQMSDAERRRLLYVACTRAVDHLIVSLHRYPDSKPGETAESGRLLFANGAADDSSRARPMSPTAGRFVGDRPDAPELDWPEYEAWEAARRRAFAEARFRPSVSATYLAGEADTDPGLDKGAVDLDLPPWQRGRYGTAVGRAVHAVAAIRRSAHRCRHRRRGSGTVRRRGHRRDGLDRRRPRPLGDRRADRSTGARPPPPPRALRRCAGRRAHRRGVSRPVRRDARRRHHRRLQDRSVARRSGRRSTGRPDRAVPTPARRLRRRGRAVARRAGRGGDAGALPPRRTRRGDRDRPVARSARRSARSHRRDGLTALKSPDRLSRNVASAKIAPNAIAIGSSTAPRMRTRASKNGWSKLVSTDVPSTCRVRIGSSISGQSTSVSDTPITSSPPKCSIGSDTRDVNNPRSGCTTADTRYVSPSSRYWASRPYRMSIRSPSNANGSGSPERTRSISKRTVR
ncbi:MAG: UvrD-helicase domain-containing protein, partial [Ilumatobacteraceae bacterium]